MYSSIEQKAKETGRKYNECFREYIKEATKKAESDLKFAIENGYHIIWDQTNLTAESRAKKIPRDRYRFFGYYNLVSDEILVKRNEQRKSSGRDIPLKWFKDLDWSYPSESEGFELVYTNVGPWRN